MADTLIRHLQRGPPSEERAGSGLEGASALEPPKAAVVDAVVAGGSAAPRRGEKSALMDGDDTSSSEEEKDERRSEGAVRSAEKIGTGKGEKLPEDFDHEVCVQPSFNPLRAFMLVRELARRGRGERESLRKWHLSMSWL